MYVFKFAEAFHLLNTIWISSWLKFIGLVISELNKNLKFPDNVGFYPDIKDGVRGYNTDAARGADTFFPFSNAEICLTGAINYYSNGANAHNCDWGVIFNPYNLNAVSEGSNKSGSSGYAYVSLPKGRYSIALSNIDASANAYLSINGTNILSQNDKTVVTLEDSTDAYFYINKASSGSVTLVIAIEKL